MHKVIILGFPLIFLFVAGAWPQEVWIAGRVQAILDGDTIVVNKKIIRLAGIDAPEKDQASFEGKAIGKWSTEILKQAIGTKVVSVQILKKGYYGRWIGEVYLNRQNINRFMVAKGAAISLKTNWYPLQYRARLSRIGMFKTSGFLAPKEFRRRKKGHPKMAHNLSN